MYQRVWTTFYLFYGVALASSISNPFPPSTTIYFPTPSLPRRTPNPIPQSPSAPGLTPSPSPSSPPPVCTTTRDGVRFPRGCTPAPSSSAPPPVCTHTGDGIPFPLGCTPAPSSSSAPPACTTILEFGGGLPRGCTIPPTFSSSAPPTCQTNTFGETFPRGCTTAPSSQSSSGPPPTCTRIIEPGNALPRGCTTASSSQSSSTPPPACTTILEFGVGLPRGCTIPPTFSSSAPPTCSTNTFGETFPRGCTTAPSSSSSSGPPPPCTRIIEPGNALPRGCTIASSSSSSPPPSSSSSPPSSSAPPPVCTTTVRGIPLPRGCTQSNPPSSSTPPPSSSSPPPSSSSPPPACTATIHGTPFPRGCTQSNPPSSSTPPPSSSSPPPSSSAPPPVCTTTVRGIPFPRGCTQSNPPSSSSSLPPSSSSPIPSSSVSINCEIIEGPIPSECISSTASPSSSTPPPSSSSPPPSSSSPPACTTTVRGIPFPRGCTQSNPPSSSSPSSSSPPSSSPVPSSSVSIDCEIVEGPIPPECLSSSTPPPSSSSPAPSSSINCDVIEGPIPPECFPSSSPPISSPPPSSVPSSASSPPPSSSPQPSSSAVNCEIIEGPIPPECISSSSPPPSSSAPPPSDSSPAPTPSRVLVLSESSSNPASVSPASSVSPIPPPTPSPSPPPSLAPVVSSVLTTISGSATFVPTTLSASQISPSPPAPLPSPIVSSALTTISGVPTLIPVTITPSAPPSPIVSSALTTISGVPTLIPVTITPSAPPSAPPSPIVSSALTTISGKPTLIPVTITPSASPSPSVSGGGGGGGGGGGSSSSSSGDPSATQALFRELQQTRFPVIAYTTGGLTAVLVIAGGLLGLMGFHALTQHSDARTSAGEYAPLSLQDTIVGVGEDGSGGGGSSQGRLVPAFIARLDPITVFLHFQAISSSGLLSLNYPAIYRSFTLNFAWANFIIVPSGSFSSFVDNLKRKRDGDVSLNLTGIEVYATGLKIDPKEISTIVYFVFMGACAIFVVFLLLALLVCQIMIWKRGKEDEEGRTKWLRRRVRVQQLASSNSLRLINLAIGALATFGFWQWTRSSTSPIRSFLSALAFIAVTLTLSVVIYLIVRLSYKPGGILLLFDAESSPARRWGTLYDTLHEKTILFVVPLTVAVILRSAIVGFGQSGGLEQACALILVESVIFVVILIFKPYYSTGYNRLNYLLKACNVLMSVLVLPFAKEIGLTGSGAKTLGIFLVVFQSLIAAFLVILTVLKLGWGIVWYRKKHHAFTKATMRYRKVSGMGHDD